MFGAMLAGRAAEGLMGSLFDKGDDFQSIDLARIKELQSGTQGLVDEQLGISRQMMDPQSAINMQMRNLMSQRASETGAQVGSQAMKLGAMRNVSPGQAMMQQRMAQNTAMGGVNQNWLQQLQGRFGQGVGLMGNMTQVQQGLDENIANAYVQNTIGQNVQGGGGGGVPDWASGLGSDISGYIKGL